MRQINEVLRLHFESKLSQRAISRSCGLARSTIDHYLRLFEASDIPWPLPDSMGESELQEKLCPHLPDPRPKSASRPMPDWGQIHQQLRGKNVTLKLLWKEYRQDHPDGYGLSQFYANYNQWASKIEPSLRQVHAPGEKMFVDWAGTTVPIRDPKTGEDSNASIFVAVLGFSQKIFVRAYENQQIQCWTDAHAKSFEFYGGVPELVIPDNPKTAVLKPCRYEPGLNASYSELAEHYGCAILPTRPYKPRDKAKVETAVQIVQREILAALRHRTFFDLGELNKAIEQKLDELNKRPFAKLSGSRQELFTQQEQQLLKPLPNRSYEFAQWKKAKVNIDYHVAVDKHLYSVPYRLIHQEVDVRLSRSMVEIHHNGTRIAAHRRSQQPGKFTTIAEHLPKSHQKHLEWSPGRLLNWARKTGPLLARVVDAILNNRSHPEHGYRSCLGLMRLSRNVGAQRMEAACKRALNYGTCTYKSIESILENKLDQSTQQKELPLTAPEHPNLRGADYYK